MKELDKDQPCDILVGGKDTPYYPKGPGERRYTCSMCTSYLWLMPAGQERLERWPNTQVICHECAHSLYEDSSIQFHIVSRDELTRDLRGDSARANDLITRADELIEAAIRRAKSKQ